MSDAKRLRVGMIGCGGMGQGHCRTMAQKVPEMVLAAVCDSDAATAQKVGQEYGVPSFTDYNELARSGLCDAVIVATPHPQHPPASLACLKAGLHVLTEKPLSENIATADQMVRTAKRRNLTLAVMFQQRYVPVCRKAIEIVRSGALGRIIRATMIAPDYRSQAYYNAGKWRATWKGEGGGVLLNQNPHMMDFFVNLTGRPKSVFGMTATAMHKIEVEDLAEARLEFPGGGTGYIYASTTEPAQVLTVEVYGDKGKLLFRDWQLRFFRFPTPITEFTANNTEMWGKPAVEEVKLDIPSVESGHADVMRDFARHILFDEPLFCSGESGLTQLEVANAIILSGKLGKPVKLPLNRTAYTAMLAKLRAQSKEKRGIVEKRITDPNFRK
jgi:predicted dehydrogenase